MSGGSQAHLLQAEDGKYYVTKFLNNPQSCRILVNEHVASLLLQQIGIATPKAALIRVTPDFLRGNPEVHFVSGHRRRAVVPGLHFGSEFPGNPHTTAVFDLLPSTVISRVCNLAHFSGVFAFDRWTSNSDARQSILVRTHLQRYGRHLAKHPLSKGFIALMIDNGCIFGGSGWTFFDSSPKLSPGLRALPEALATPAESVPWIERILRLRDRDINDAFAAIPNDWIDDRVALEWVRARLLRRRDGLAQSMDRSIASVVPFNPYVKPLTFGR